MELYFLKYVKNLIKKGDKMKKVLLLLVFAILPMLFWFVQQRVYESIELMSKDKKLQYDIPNDERSISRINTKLKN